MKRYAKFGYAAPLRFRVILEKSQGGPKWPPTRAKVKYEIRRSCCVKCVVFVSNGSYLQETEGFRLLVLRSHHYFDGIKMAWCDCTVHTSVLTRQTTFHYLCNSALRRSGRRYPAITGQAIRGGVRFRFRCSITEPLWLWFHERKPQSIYLRSPIP